MAAYTDIYNLRYSSASLKNKVTVAIAKAAQTVMNEATNASNHSNRLSWAKRVLTTDTQAEAEKFMWGVVCDNSIVSKVDGVTDAEVQSVVDSLLNLFAQ